MTETYRYVIEFGYPRSDNYGESFLCWGRSRPSGGPKFVRAVRIDPLIDHVQPTKITRVLMLRSQRSERPQDAASCTVGGKTDVQGDKRVDSQ